MDKPEAPKAAADTGPGSSVVSTSMVLYTIVTLTIWILMAARLYNKRRQRRRRLADLEANQDGVETVDPNLPLEELLSGRWRNPESPLVSAGTCENWSTDSVRGGTVGSRHERPVRDAFVLLCKEIGRVFGRKVRSPSPPIRKVFNVQFDAVRVQREEIGPVVTESAVETRCPSVVSTESEVSVARVGAVEARYPRVVSTEMHAAMTAVFEECSVRESVLGSQVSSESIRESRPPSEAAEVSTEDRDFRRASWRSSVTIPPTVQEESEPESVERAEHPEAQIPGRAL